MSERRKGHGQGKPSANGTKLSEADTKPGGTPHEQAVALGRAVAEKVAAWSVALVRRDPLPERPTFSTRVSLTRARGWTHDE